MVKGKEVTCFQSVDDLIPLLDLDDGQANALLNRPSPGRICCLLHIPSALIRDPPPYLCQCPASSSESGLRMKSRPFLQTLDCHLLESWEKKINVNLMSRNVHCAPGLCEAQLYMAACSCLHLAHLLLAKFCLSPISAGLSSELESRAWRAGSTDQLPLAMWPWIICITLLDLILPCSYTKWNSDWVAERIKWNNMYMRNIINILQAELDIHTNWSFFSLCLWSSSLETLWEGRAQKGVQLWASSSHIPGSWKDNSTLTLRGLPGSSQHPSTLGLVCVGVYWSQWMW